MEYTSQFIYEQKQFLKKVSLSAKTITPFLVKPFQKLRESNSLRDANLYLADFLEKSGRLKGKASDELKKYDFWRSELNLAAEDEELNEFCKAKSRQCERLYSVTSSEELGSTIEKLLKSYGINLSKKDSETITEQRMYERLIDERWWRRKVKTMAFRECEQIMREMGQVSKSEGCYVSDFTLKRYMDRETRNHNLLNNLEAVNEEGEKYTLDELSQLGISNPVNCRGELMLRMRGFEEWAESQQEEWVPMFYTITCPSKYHIYSGDKKNAKYIGKSVRDGQQYLNSVWARIRSRCDRRNIKYFGFRVAEPHHDGTPHWHLLLFVLSEQSAGLTSIIAEGALEEDGHEKGASKHRFESVEIEKERGTAAGYIAKYISKNVDGFAVDWDIEAGDRAAITAVRVKAWASTWGIRQFQQIGGPPVTVYREVRRLCRSARQQMPGNRPEQMQIVFEAANSGDWRQFVDAMGGAVGRREKWPVRLWYLLRERCGKYAEQVKFVAGIEFVKSIFDLPIKTRVHEWTISLARVGGLVRGATAPPWTRVNNCTEVNLEECAIY